MFYNYEIYSLSCWDLEIYLVIYDVLYDMATWTFLLSVDEILWYYFAAMFEKINYASLDLYKK